MVAQSVGLHADRAMDMLTPASINSVNFTQQ